MTAAWDAHAAAAAAKVQLDAAQAEGEVCRIAREAVERAETNAAAAEARWKVARERVRQLAATCP